MTEPVTEISTKQDRICLDCGKQITLNEAWLDVQYAGTPEQIAIHRCPRCMSSNIREYETAKHENITIKVPDGYVDHPLECKALELFERVSKMTGWREQKVRLFFQLNNPLLGGVSPEWMIMNDRADRLERFIAEAEGLATDHAGLKVLSREEDT